MSCCQWKEFTHRTQFVRVLFLLAFCTSLLLFGFDFFPFALTDHIYCPAERTPQWHMWKFLRVRILFKSSATSKNKLCFNMHCVWARKRSERAKEQRFASLTKWCVQSDHMNWNIVKRQMQKPNKIYGWLWLPVCTIIDVGWRQTQRENSQAN